MRILGHLLGRIATVVVFLLSMSCSQTPDNEDMRGQVSPSVYLPSSPELLELGKKTYDQYCVLCHGAEGDSRGDAFELLHPKPRDFVMAYYRMVSTWDGIATDEDIFRAISRGMSGSAMPGWAHLSERQRWALVHYIKTFAKFPFEIGPDHQPENEDDIPTGHIVVPPEALYDEEAQARAEYLFVEVCAGCHGESGRGDGADADEQENSEGFPVRPRDLTAGIFKGDPAAESLYKRLSAGLPGSPMPSHSYLYGDDVWHLVHRVRSLSTEEVRAQAQRRRSRIVVQQVEKLPDEPESPLWGNAQEVAVNLMPLWWQDDLPRLLTIQALHDGQEIAIKLIWADDAHHHASPDAMGRVDAAVVKLSDRFDPEFFGIGSDPDQIGLWLWASDPTAGREVPFRELTDQPPVPDPDVEVVSTVSGPLHQVVFRRSLGGRAFPLGTADTFSVSFGIWDTGGPEEEGRKLVTLWQDLYVPSTGLWDSLWGGVKSLAEEEGSLPWGR